MDEIDDYVLIIIFSFVKDYESQLLRLVCKRFDVTINSFDSIYARYLTGINPKDPFWWLSDVPYFHRGSILRWIVNDLGLLKKLKQSYLFHYPLQFDEIDQLLKMIPTSPHQTIESYGEALSDTNLKPFSDFLGIPINNRDRYPKQMKEIKSLRYDIIFANGAKNLDFESHLDLLIKLAKIGKQKHFNQWYDYFEKHGDWRYYNNPHFYTDNVEFFKFAIRLGKLYSLQIKYILEKNNFNVLNYLMDNYKDIEECGIQKCHTIIETIETLSHYRGKRGKELFHWMKSTYYIGIGAHDLDIFLRFNNLELLQLIMKNHIDQIDYTNFSSKSYSFSINSAKVFHYLSSNFNYSHQGKDYVCIHSCIKSIKLLIHLFKNGYHFPSRVTYRGDVFPKENMIKLLKQPDSIIIEYFQLLFKNHSLSQYHLIIQKYLDTLLEKIENVTYTEEEVLKVCRCIIQSGCDYQKIFDHIHKSLIHSQFFTTLLYLQKNDCCILPISSHSHTFKMFAKKFLGSKF